MDIEIRKAEQADLAAIKALLERCALPSNDLEVILENFIVATRKDTIVGCAGFESYDSHALFRSLAVHERERGGGVASSLIEKLKEKARAAGLSKAFVLTTTIESMLLKKGFVRESDAPAALLDSPQFKGLCPKSASLLSVEL